MLSIGASAPVGANITVLLAVSPCSLGWLAPKMNSPWGPRGYVRSKMEVDLGWLKTAAVEALGVPNPNKGSEVGEGKDWVCVEPFGPKIFFSNSTNCW